jgi:hypothetical protein
VATLPIDADAARVIEPELSRDERILWAGKPDPAIHFHKDDIIGIPLGFFVAAFTVIWSGLVFGYLGKTDRPAPLGFWLFGIPVFFFGQYALWGRFVHAAWRKKRTFYAVTDRRVLVVRNGFHRRVATAFLDTLPTVILEANRGSDVGTLQFREPAPMAYRLTYPQDSGLWAAHPTFVDIHGVTAVHGLLLDLRHRPQPDRS